MATKSHLNPYEYDSRMINWNLKNKFLTPDKLKSFLANLPDDAANCEPLEIEVDEVSVEGDH